MGRAGTYDKKSILITGGAGFIGVNAAEAFIQDGWQVTLLDNLSRKGTDLNLRYLQRKYPQNCAFVHADIRYDHYPMLRAIENCELVLHLAGQVAVTTSVTRPREDFEINALGTINLLEAVRESGHRPMVIYASTNKVYGGMEDVAVLEGERSYGYRDCPYGISEERPMDFHSPYGCSKGAADQYVRDYARIYDIPTVVFRQSCIYGPRQFGIEDQGWVAWFAIAAMLGKSISVYGDGKQVRDLLHVSDLIRAYQLAAANPSKASGMIYNVGGGPERVLSINELLEHLEKRLKRRIPFTSADWRPGDQRVFVSDIRKIQNDLGWSPRFLPLGGVDQLLDWIESNRSTIARLFTPVDSQEERPLVLAHAANSDRHPRIQ